MPQVVKEVVHGLLFRVKHRAQRGKFSSSGKDKKDVSTDGERGENCYGPQLTALPKAKMFKISPLNPYVSGMSEAGTSGGVQG